MKHRVPVIVGVVVLLLALVGITSAFAWGPRDNGNGSLSGYGHYGMHGEYGLLIAVAAEELGLTPAELMEELATGKSIAQVAEERGVAVEAIVEAFLADHQEWFGQALSDEWLAQMEAHVTQMLTQAGPYGLGAEGHPCGGGDVAGTGMSLTGRGGFGHMGGGGFSGMGRGGIGMGMTYH